MRSKLASAHTRPTARLPSQLFVGCSPVLDQPTLIQEGKVQFDTVHRHNFLINAVTASHIHETWADCYLRSCCIDGAANVGDELHGNRTDDNQRNKVINNDQQNKTKHPSGSLLALVGGQRANCHFVSMMRFFGRSTGSSQDRCAVVDMRGHDIYIYK